jgi:hypothetical protein
VFQPGVGERAPLDSFAHAGSTQGRRRIRFNLRVLNNGLIDGRALRLMASQPSASRSMP